MNQVIGTLLVGIGATLVIDLWALLRRGLFGTALPNYAFVGRWIGHMASGRFRHDSMARAAPIAGELWIGWALHYTSGVAFAGVLAGIGGRAWMLRPTLGLALLVGISTVAAPFLLMQPGMGAGVAASRTPHPGAARLQSLITHTVFGLGLFAAARVVSAAF